MTTFDSTKTELGKVLDEIVAGRIQLPDFQRGWVWDDEHIRSLLVSIARSFPIGAVMPSKRGARHVSRSDPSRVSSFQNPANPSVSSWTDSNG